MSSNKDLFQDKFALMFACVFVGSMISMVLPVITIMILQVWLDAKDLYLHYLLSFILIFITGFFVPLVDQNNILGLLCRVVLFILIGGYIYYGLFAYFDLLAWKGILFWIFNSSVALLVQFRLLQLSNRQDEE